MALNSHIWYICTSESLNEQGSDRRAICIGVFLPYPFGLLASVTSLQSILGVLPLLSCHWLCISTTSKVLATETGSTAPSGSLCAKAEGPSALWQLFAGGFNHLAMDQYLLIAFLGGWTSINPSYFDVNYRGTRFWHTAISKMFSVQTCRLSQDVIVWEATWTNYLAKLWKRDMLGRQPVPSVFGKIQRFGFLGTCWNLLGHETFLLSSSLSIFDLRGSN
jgi:hypothetical protein